MLVFGGVLGGDTGFLTCEVRIKEPTAAEEFSGSFRRCNSKRLDEGRSCKLYSNINVHFNYMHAGLGVIR